MMDSERGVGVQPRLREILVDTFGSPDCEGELLFDDDVFDEATDRITALLQGREHLNPSGETLSHMQSVLTWQRTGNDAP